MKAFFQLLGREFIRFKGNSVITAIFIGAPLFYGILVAAVYTQATISDLPITVVDLDQSTLSHRIIDALEDNPYVEVAKVRHTEDSVAHDILHHSVAVVRIPDAFEADIHQKRHPEIQTEINGANMITANYANIGIRTVLGTLNAGIEIGSLQKKGTPHRIARTQFEAFQIGSTRYYNANSNYLTFMWPGVMGTILQQVFLLAMALTFAAEFEQNTFHEIRARSKNAIVVLLAKSLPYWLVGMALWMGIQQLFFPIVKLPAVQDQLALWALMAVFMWALSSAGALVSWLLPSQLKATEILMVLATPSFIVSGFSWPLSEMPKTVQYFAEMIPLTHFLAAFRKILFFGGQLHDIQPEIYKLTVSGAVTSLLALVLIQLKLRKQDSQTANA